MADSLRLPEPNISPSVILEPRQADLLTELGTIDPHLGGLFRSGLRLAASLDEPGNIFLLAHVGRELLLGVTRRLAATSPALLADLDRELSAEAPLTPESDLGDATEDSDASDAAGEARRDKHRRTLGEALQLDPSHPLVTRWLHVYREIQATAHYNTSPRSPAAIQHAFQQVTHLLYAIIGPYFETQPVLDTLLAKEVPSKSDIDLLRDAMPRPAQRAYFFERLGHPGWLTPLAKRHYFDPPAALREFRGSGQRGWLPWPEGTYLVRMAAVQPQAVQRLLASILPGNTNPIVWQTAGKATQAMPPAQAKRMVPLLIEGLKLAPGPFVGFAVSPVVKTVAAEGDAKAISLLDALLYMARRWNYTKQRRNEPPPPMGSERF